jgi:uncharacterized protein (TIGR02265 family)
MMKIKGLILHAREEFVRDHFGKEAWENVIAALPAEDQNIIRSLVITAKWYPFEIGERLDKAIVEVLGGGDEYIFEEIGIKSAQRSLHKVHKSFIVKGDPQAFMKKADMIYKFYYDEGHREYRETGPTSGVMTTYEATTFSIPDCMTVIGWYKEALKMCGARNVEAEEEECRARGGTCCRYRFKWEI